MFVFVGVRLLVFRGDFSMFLPLWLPLGLTTIFLWGGLRGLSRIAQPDREHRLFDSRTFLCICAGGFLGFFCGGKITHDILISIWGGLDSDPLLLSMLCLVGALTGSFVGPFIVGFPLLVVVGSITRLMKWGKKQDRE